MAYPLNNSRSILEMLLACLHRNQSCVSPIGLVVVCSCIVRCRHTDRFSDTLHDWFGKYCANSNKQTSISSICFPVSLSVKDGENICPFHPITLRCVVNTTVSQEPSPFLSWKCTATSADNFLICSDIVAFNCAFGKVDNIIGSCDCGGSIIVSEATFTPSSTDARTIVCSDGPHEEEIPVVPRGMYMLGLQLALEMCHVFVW